MPVSLLPLDSEVRGSQVGTYFCRQQPACHSTWKFLGECVCVHWLPNSTRKEMKLLIWKRILWCMWGPVKKMDTWRWRVQDSSRELHPEVLFWVVLHCTVQQQYIRWKVSKVELRRSNVSSVPVSKSPVQPPLSLKQDYCSSCCQKSSTEAHNSSPIATPPRGVQKCRQQGP